MGNQELIVVVIEVINNKNQNYNYIFLKVLNLRVGSHEINE